MTLLELKYIMTSARNAAAIAKGMVELRSIVFCSREERGRWRQGPLIVQAYRVRRSTSRYGLSHRDQSRRDVWMGVITPHFRDRCITPSWMTALGHFLSTPSLSSLPERPV